MITPMQDPSQGPSWLRNPDPLGIGLRQRARDFRSSINPSGLGDQGPLRDPMWEGLFQAMDEQNVSRVGQQGGQFGPLPSTIDQRLPQRGMMQQLSQSQHIGNTHPAIKALRGAR